MKTATKTWIGLILWIAFVLLLRALPTDVRWSHSLLVFFAVVLMPLALDLIAERRDTGAVLRLMELARKAQLPAGLLLTLSLSLKPGILAGVVSLAWTGFTVLLAFYGVQRILRDRWSRPPERLAVDVGLVFLVLAALWVVLERSIERPFGMERELVAFGSVYLHVTGLFLPMLGGMALRQMPDSRFGARGVIGSVLTIPALAVGVLLAHPGWTSALEAAGGVGLAISGTIVAILYLRWAVDAKGVAALARALVVLAGVALFLAVLPAAAYSLRTFIPIMDVNVHELAMIHGSLITFGFALCGTLAWRIREKS